MDKLNNKIITTLICPVCKNDNFNQNTVITKRLSDEWNLSSLEENYINKQQGKFCTKCNSSLRSMTLANSILEYYKYDGCFKDFCQSKYKNKLNVLEVNEAGHLHIFLENFKNHQFAEYPNVDIQKLPYEDNIFDFIVHSDTLEHVEDSLLGLKECHRVLKSDGVLFYTIPIVYERMTKLRDGYSDSYHGSQNENQGEDWKVITEYGADFWVEIFDAGFNEICISKLDDKASFAIIAKTRNKFSYKFDFIAFIRRLNQKLKSKMDKK